MKLPVQAPPVKRSSAATTQTVTQSGCCVRVAGQCVLESPIC